VERKKWGRGIREIKRKGRIKQDSAEREGNIRNKERQKQKRERENRYLYLSRVPRKSLEHESHADSKHPILSVQHLQAVFPSLAPCLCFYGSVNRPSSQIPREPETLKY
jgi:hypothetical protein